MTNERRGSAANLVAAFEVGRCTERPLVIPFVTAGYPEPKATVPIVRALAEAGADLVEIGLPFSDPLADGPTIQRASEAALRAGMSVPGALEIVASVRQGGSAAFLPVVLMGYCNPLFAYGLERFLADATAAGVDGLIVPDLPPEEGADYRDACREHGIAATFLVAPNAPDERVRRVDEFSTHFSYCVTVTGVTGARSQVEERTVAFLQRVRRLAEKPFVVGFGIQDPEHVTTLGRYADGVVIGSALIEKLAGAADPAARAAELVSRLRRAADDLGARRQAGEKPA